MVVAGSAPLLALVGRPNVGKSSLFNRLTRTREALVDNTPGLTRDRKYGVGVWANRPFRVVDTGGFEFDARDSVLAGMQEQAMVAIEEADIILFVTDARSGPLSHDVDLARMLRRCGRPVVCVANKSDGTAGEEGAMELHALGLEPVIAISATHGLGVDAMLRYVFTRLSVEAAPREEDEEAFVVREEEGPEAGFEDDAEDGETEDEGGDAASVEPDGGGEGEVARVAIVGCPNAGKSTLINRLLGEERLVTSDQPGTTRDAVDSEWVDGAGRRYVLVDTAGIRRKARVTLRIEKYSALASLRAMERAGCAVLVLDAERGITEQDQRVAGYAIEAGCGLVFAVNKWDRVSGGGDGAEKAFRQELGVQFPRFSHAPVVFLSARSGWRVDRLLPEARRVWEAGRKRISTGVLNRWLAEVEAANPPPRSGGRPVKIRFVSQVRSNPPMVVFFVNRPDAVPESYRRYLENRLRDHFGFQGVPLRLSFRSGGDNPFRGRER